MAADAGAAWGGVILAPGRGRTQTLDGAAAIFEGAPLRRVGVFVDAAVDEVVEAVGVLSLDAAQLHGDETVATAERIRAAAGCEVWKALRVRTPADAASGALLWHGVADALLLDGWSPDAHGGAGVRFDWPGVAAAGMPAGMRLVVAGGLTPENVAGAIAMLRPSIVDVSSGVESAPGRKSPGKVHAFVAAVRG